MHTYLVYAMCQSDKLTAETRAATREAKTWKSRVNVTICGVRLRPNKFAGRITAWHRSRAAVLLSGGILLAQLMMWPIP
ncbi:MAG: hypothetical protein WBW69_12920 [Candidatus Korobacteraceae bacterium]